MAAQEQSTDEPIGSVSGDREHERGPGIGTLLFATACGIGLGMLTAPEAGRQTRKRLRKSLATIGGEVVDRWSDVNTRLGEVRQAGSRAGRRVRSGMRDRAGRSQEAAERWSATQARIAELEARIERLSKEDRDEYEENEGGGVLSATLGLAAGAGLAYFMMADDAAPARSKVQQVASDVRQQATDRWQQFRRGGARSPADATAFTDADEM